MVVFNVYIRRSTLFSPSMQVCQVASLDCGIDGDPFAFEATKCELVHRRIERAGHIVSQVDWSIALNNFNVARK